MKKTLLASLVLVALVNGWSAPTFADQKEKPDSKSSSSSPGADPAPKPEARYGHEIETRGRLGFYPTTLLFALGPAAVDLSTLLHDSSSLSTSKIVAVSFMAFYMGALGLFFDAQIVADVRIDFKLGKLWKILGQECPKLGCEVFSVGSKWNGSIVPKVVFPDGWYIIFDRDPGVVEIRGYPLSNGATQQNLERMQKVAYDLAAKAGLYPPRFLNLTNGGHVSIDFAIFDQDPPPLSKLPRGFHESLRNLQWNSPE